MTEKKQTLSLPQKENNKTQNQAPKKELKNAHRKPLRGYATDHQPLPIKERPTKERTTKEAKHAPKPRKNEILARGAASKYGETPQHSVREAHFSPAPKAAPLEDYEGKERLSKLMAAQGICSRREADIFIEKGKVLVDGIVVNTLGTRVLPSAKIELKKEAQAVQDAQVTILLHKPVGYVSGQPEPGFTPAITLIKSENEWIPTAKQKGDPHFVPTLMLKNLAPAGRLDVDSTGLLVFTQDGRIARQLIGEDSAVSKEYLVRVEGEIIDNGLALLNHGLSLDDKALKPAKVSWQNDDQLRFVLHEGKKRQIRRMCELVGLQVVGLKRVRVGKIMLGHLPVGQWRFLLPEEGF